MLSVRSIEEQLNAHKSRLASSATRDHEQTTTRHNIVQPVPSSSASSSPSRPTVSALASNPSSSGAFPPSTWHAPLPSTGLPSLQHWVGEGLPPAAEERIRNVISVYSLGFHQLIKAVRADLAQPSSTVANMWKMFIFLLHDSMPDGSIHQTMRIAALEREQSQRARELIAQREAELARLLALESSLQQSVIELDQALRGIQSQRQEAEDARLEALDSIEEQETLQKSNREEIHQLELEAEKWKRRFELAANRHRMLSEDLRQYQRMQSDLRAKQHKMTNQQSALEHASTREHDAYGTLVSSYDWLQGKHQRTQQRARELEHACRETTLDVEAHASRLSEIAQRIGALTAASLRKVQERILVVKQVEKIKSELTRVVDQELAAVTDVQRLETEASALTVSVEELKRARDKVIREADALRSDITKTEEATAAKEAQITEEKKKLSELNKTIDKKDKQRSQLQSQIIKAGSYT